MSQRSPPSRIRKISVIFIKIKKLDLKFSYCIYFIRLNTTTGWGFFLIYFVLFNTLYIEIYNFKVTRMVKLIKIIYFQVLWLIIMSVGLVLLFSQLKIILLVVSLKGLKVWVIGVIPKGLRFLFTLIKIKLPNNYLINFESFSPFFLLYPRGLIIDLEIEDSIGTFDNMINLLL